MAIAMTFDDGPEPKTTPQLLNFLRELKLTATFFVLGSRVKQSQGIIKRIAEEGHEICNHSWNHPAFSDKRKNLKLTNTQIRDQILNTQKAIEDAGGKAVSKKIFRPPYGMITDDQKTFIRNELGYQICGWHVDSYDSRSATNSAQISKNITTFTTDGKIVLAHDIHQKTINAMKTALPFLKDKAKFKFYTVSELNKFPHNFTSFVECGCGHQFV